MHSVALEIRDLTDTEVPALRGAQAVAPDSARLHLYHNVYHRHLIDAANAHDPVVQEARELLLSARRDGLKTLAKSHFGEAASITVECAQRGWPGLLTLAVQAHCDLVVTASEARPRWQRLGLANADWQLIRHCPVPLLLARANVPARYRRVVAAIDPLHVDDKPAQLDQDILRHAAAVAARHGAKFSALNVACPVTVAAPASLGAVLPSYDGQAELLDAHRRKVHELASAVSTDCEECVISADTPSTAIIDFVAEQKADLLVMGAVSRSMLSRLLIGNTAERVLDRVACDVLIIKPGGLAIELPAARLASAGDRATS